VWGPLHFSILLLLFFSRFRPTAGYPLGLCRGLRSFICFASWIGIGFLFSEYNCIWTIILVQFSEQLRFPTACLSFTPYVLITDRMLSAKFDSKLTIPSCYVSVGTKFHVSKLRPEHVSAYRQYEKDKVQKNLDEYIQQCSKLKVHTNKQSFH
jgi:hypothetical protein